MINLEGSHMVYRVGSHDGYAAGIDARTKMVVNWNTYEKG